MTIDEVVRCRQFKRNFKEFAEEFELLAFVEGELGRNSRRTENHEKLSSGEVCTFTVRHQWYRGRESDANPYVFWQHTFGRNTKPSTMVVHKCINELLKILLAL